MSVESELVCDACEKTRVPAKDISEPYTAVTLGAIIVYKYKDGWTTVPLLQSIHICPTCSLGRPMLREIDKILRKRKRANV